MVDLVRKDRRSLRQLAVFTGLLRPTPYPHPPLLSHAYEAVRGAPYSSTWTLSMLSRSLWRTMCSYSAFSSEDKLPAVLLAASSATCPARSFCTASMADSNLSRGRFFIMTLHIACRTDHGWGTRSFFHPAMGGAISSRVHATSERCAGPLRPPGRGPPRASACPQRPGPSSSRGARCCRS